MLEEMTDRVSSWLAGDGEQSRIVLSSRVRLARNVKGMVYPPYANTETRTRVVDFIHSALEKSKELDHGLFFRSEEISDLDRAFLIERHLISPEFLHTDTVSGLFISSDERLAVMINEEDHLRIQAINSGLAITTALENAMRVDDELSRTLEFDFDNDFGYLTSCPTNVGTGLRASVLIHLAGLVLTKEIDSVIDHITKLGLVVRGFYGEGTDVFGNLFQVSNQTTLGRSEADITEALQRITLQIIEFENKAREQLITQAPDEISDKIWRAFGILKHARVLTSEEVMNLLSAVRLGIALEIINDVSLETVNRLLILSQPAHLQKHIGSELTASERDVARADLVREMLT